MKVELKFCEPALKISDNIAIVGSSGKLLQTEYGETIDEFEDVVRFNRAPTREEFDKYVGSKTTVRVVNNHVFNNNVLDVNDWTDQPPNFVKDLRDTRVLYVAEDMAPFFDSKNALDLSNTLHLFNYGWMPTLRQFFDCEHNFSVGTTFILLCVHSGIKPACFGFDAAEDGGRTHYFEKRPPPSGYHNVDREKKVLTDLFLDGKIYLF